MLLVLGTNFLPQTKSVIDKIIKLGVKPTVIDLDKNDSVSISINEEGLVINNLNSSSFNVVWLQSKFLFPYFGNDNEWADKYITGKMRKSVYQNIIEALSCEVLNSIASQNKCATKLKQLLLAQDVGFNIPKTFISNDINQIIEFKGNNETIVKAIDDPHIPSIKEDRVGQESLFTMKMDVDYLKKNKNSKESFPVYLQNFISKKYEYRCVLVDDEIFSFQIDPNQHALMQVDYRRGGFMVEYKPFDLPNPIKDLIFKFAKKCDLFSGCFDLVEDEDGQFIFLEVNIHGIWAYHDDLLNGTISQKFAESIVARYEKSLPKNRDNTQLQEALI